MDGLRSSISRRRNAVFGRLRGAGVTTVILGGTLVALPALGALPAGADLVPPTYLGPSFQPTTAPVCTPGFSVLKFTGGTTFGDGAHANEKSSGDPTKEASWTISGAANTLSLSEAKIGGVTASVSEVIISDNGAGEAYSWKYDPNVIPSVGAPLLHTGSAGSTPQIMPMTDNQFLFVCAAPVATMTLVKQIDGGPATVADFPLSASGSPLTNVISGTAAATGTVTPGSHTLSETTTLADPAAYSPAPWTCTNGATSLVVSTESVVSIPGGSNVTCTVTNVYDYSDLAITKTPRTSSVLAGGTVEFDVVVTNLGPTSATNVSWTDTPTGFTGGCTASPPSMSLLELAVGGTVSWVVTCAGATGTSVDNVATLTPATLTENRDPAGDTNDSDDAPLTVASMTLDKSADRTYFTAAGQTIGYTFVIRNTGGSSLSNVALSDPKIVGPYTCATTPGGASVSLPATVPAGEGVTCTASYVTTIADVDANQVPNTAALTATGSPAITDSVTVPLAELSITKVAADPPVDGYVAGSVIDYTITTTNTGGMPLADVTTSDTNGTLGICQIEGVTVTVPASLAIGDVLICHATHLVSQADVDAGTYSNTATASSEQAPQVEASAVVEIARTPAITLTKTVDPAPGGPFTVGDVVDYTLVATNSGTVTLNDVVVGDATDPVGTCAPAIPATLAPSATITCPVQHTITVGDAAAGSYVNTATATGIPVGQDETVTATATATVPTFPTADVTITKSDSVDPVTAGQNLIYTLSVTNAGPNAAADVVVTDAIPAGTSFVSVTGPGCATTTVGAPPVVNGIACTIGGLNADRAGRDDHPDRAGRPGPDDRSDQHGECGDVDGREDHPRQRRHRAHGRRAECRSRYHQDGNGVVGVAGRIGDLRCRGDEPRTEHGHRGRLDRRAGRLRRVHGHVRPATTGGEHRPGGLGDLAGHLHRGIGSCRDQRVDADRRHPRTQRRPAAGRERFRRRHASRGRRDARQDGRSDDVHCGRADDHVHL